MNSRKKILLVFGTRPEAIKMASLYHAFIKSSDYFDVKVCVTAQHREMLDQVLDLFSIVPDFDLNLMKDGQDLFDITSSAILGMRAVLETYSPNFVFVHGDTTTTFSSSLAAFYKDIKICHVEAGLRTYDLRSPFPEELNRQLVSKIANIHFAPTQKSRNNLINEGIDSSKIIVTGNTVIDSLLKCIEIIDSDVILNNKIKDSFKNDLPFLDDQKEFILITGHRRESFGKGFLNICESIKELATNYPDINFIYPVHLNPNVQGPVYEKLANINNIFLIEPLDYSRFVYLLKSCYLILTDSGGIQEEAPSLGKPVLVMRDNTERPEAIDAGTVRLVGTSPTKIYKNVSELIDNQEAYKKMSLSHNPYGDGKACINILNFIKNYEK